MTAFKPIAAQWYWEDESLLSINQDEEQRIKELLMGRSIEKVSDDHLVLDDGTVIKVVPNEGGCACSAGDYWLNSLQGHENIITRGELVNEGPGTLQDYGEQHYRLFVFTLDERTEVFDIEGDDGNGYYGTGFELLVRKPA